MSSRHRPLAHIYLREALRELGCSFDFAAEEPKPEQWDDAIDAGWPRQMLVTAPSGMHDCIYFENLRYQHSTWEVELLRYRLGIRRKLFWAVVEEQKRERHGEP